MMMMYLLASSVFSSELTAAAIPNFPLPQTHQKSDNFPQDMPIEHLQKEYLHPIPITNRNSI